MPFSITTKDGITINDIPDDVAPDDPRVKARVQQIREQRRARGIGEDGLTREQRMQQIIEQERQRLIREQNEELNPLEAGLVAAGRGLTTIGRGLGLADPEDEATTRAFQDLQKRQPVATTVGEIVGESAPFLIPGAGLGAIGSTGLRVAGTAGLGALEGGLIARGHGLDIGEILFSAGIGGTAAGALELALPVIGRIGGKVFRKITNKAPKGAIIDAAGNPSDEFLRALEESGQSFDDIVRETAEELQGQVVDPRQAARKSFLESQGIEPTRAQVTRNAADFQAQQEAAKTSSRVRDALETQQAVLTSRFDNAILQSGGDANTPVSTVFDSLTEKATKLDQEVSDLYNLARATSPGEKNVRMGTLAGRLRKLAPSNQASGGAVKAIVGDLQEKRVLDSNMKVIGKIDVETAEEARKFMNSLFDPQNPFRNGLLRQLKDALDDDVFKAAGDDVFKQARKAKADFESGLSRAKVSKFDQRGDNLVRDILENKINPDDMVNKVVFGKRWRAKDLDQLKQYISTDEAGKKAFDDMRAETLQMIKDRAFIGPEDANGFRALSRDKLQKSLAQIGREKMNVLFSPPEQKFLRDMLEVAKLREPVRGTALGRGPSAQAVARLESKLRDLPILGSLVDLINIDAQGRVALRANPARLATPAPRLPSSLSQAAGAGAVATTLPEEEQQ